VLYSRVVVDDIDLFFNGLTSSTKPPSASTPTHLKALLLSRVNHINFISPLPHTRLRYPDILKSNIWDFDERKKERDETINHTQLYASYAKTSRRVSPWVDILQKVQSSHGGWSVFPHLEAVTFGTNQHVFWWNELSNSGRGPSPELEMSRYTCFSVFASLIGFMRPRMFCSRSNIDPHSICTAPQSNYLLSTNYSHATSPISFNFVPNVRNVIYVDRIVTQLKEDNGAEFPVDGFVLTYLRNIEQMVASGLELGNATIELYSVFRAIPDVGREDAMKAERLSAIREARFQAQHGKRLLETCVRNKQWRKAITLYLWKDRPLCPGCHGETEKYRTVGYT
jgi:hypothetical protein